MQKVLYSNVTKTDLAELFGHSIETIQRWTDEGLPRNRGGSYMLIKAIRWREKRFEEQQRRKVILSRVTQRDLIALTGRSRQTIFNWTKEGLPCNADRSYDLNKVMCWMPGYFKRVYERKYRKIARLVELFKVAITEERSSRWEREKRKLVKKN